ncbi:MAG: acyltransferase [Myxococcota bacterium]|nr:acyltransferase [Myxococcota bacterium]
MSSAVAAPSASHRVQLDALRAFAVSAVMVAHYANGVLPAVHRALPWGQLGVQLFFVLSGFLITGILLRLRDEVDARHFSRNSALLRFYARRALRIFPVFYATLALIVWLDVEPARETAVWHATYLSNLYFSLRGATHGPVTHFWTLALEEQFYLLWPWLVLLAPRNRLGPWIAGAVALGLIWRAGALAAGVNTIAVQWLLPGRIDNLALGALLAWAWHSGNGELRARLTHWGLWLGLPLAIAACLAHADYRRHPLTLSLTPLAFGLLFTWLVDRAAVGFGGWTGRLLAFRPLVYLGRISYGLYLLHMFVPTFIHRFAPGSAIDPAAHPLTSRAAAVPLSILLAAISWQAFEQPILRLKRRFPYATAVGER